MYSLVLGYEVLVNGFAELSCCLMMLGSIPIRLFLGSAVIYDCMQ